MARIIRSVESKEMIEASQNYTTPNSKRSLSSTSRKSQHTPSTILVEDSLKDTEQQIQNSAMPAAVDTTVHDEEDLYDISPRREARNQAVRASQKEQVEVVKDSYPKDDPKSIGQGDTAPAAQSEERNGRGEGQKRSPANSPTSKLKLLTQHTSESDIIKPAFNKTDAIEDSTSPQNKSGSSRQPGATSQTSAMVSGRKAGPAAATQASAQSGSRQLSTLERLRAKKGLSPKSRPGSAASESQPAERIARPTLFGTLTQPKTAPVTTKSATFSNATKLNALETESKGKKAVPKSQAAESGPSDGKRTSLRQSMQAETSRKEIEDPPSRNPSPEPSHKSAPKADAEAQEAPKKGKLKKASLPDKGKQKDVEDLAEGRKSAEDDVQAKFDQSQEISGLSANALQDEEDEDPVRPSRARKRGKGALQSVSKQTGKAPQAKVRATRSEEPDAEFELSTSSPNTRRRTNPRESKVGKKSPPKSQSARPTARGTGRTTRAQAAAAHKTEVENAPGEAPIPPKSKAAKSKEPAKEASAANNGKKHESKAAAAGQIEETYDEDEEEAASQSQASLKKGNPTNENPQPKVVRQQSSRKQDPRESIQREAPGGTQDNAIELSDNPPSSSAPPSPTPDRQRQTVAAEPVISHPVNVPNRPRTPANLRSSPPGFGPHDEDPHWATVASRKAQLINFGRSGPRNQGILSGKTPGSKSARQNRSSVPPAKVPIASSPTKLRLDASRRDRASSVATTTRTSRSNRLAPKSNVASNVDDALAGLTRKSKPKAPVRVQESVPPADPAPNLDDEDQGFVNIDDFEGDTLVESEEPEQRSPKGPSFSRTASQIAMPPPVKKARKGKMPALPVAEHNDEERAPTEDVPEISRGKRPRPVEPAIEHSPKRAKLSTKEPANEPETVNSEKATSAQKQATSAKLSSRALEHSVPVVETARETTRKRARDAEPPLEDTQKRTKLAADVERRHTVSENRDPQAGQGAFGQKASTSKREHRSTRNTMQRRQTSQGSQTVDIAGSPVPHDMELTGEFTVLETFSQQAAQSRVAPNELTMAMGREHESPSTQGYQWSGDSDAYRAPPSHQPGVLSSNMKPRPASPRAESRVFTGVDIRDVESKRLSSPLAETEDPFSVSQEDDVPQRRVSGFSRLTTFTKKFDTLGNQHEYRDPVKRAGRPRAASRNPSPEITKTFIKTTNKHFDKLRSITRPRHPVRESRRQEQEEDLDKTLVNDEDYAADEVEPSQHSEIEEYDYDAAANMPLSDVDPNHLMAWCKTLKPHQLSLFDQLVKCSHRITAFFAEQENNIERTLEQQHQQGLYIIEQDELLRAKEYEQVKVALSTANFESKSEMKQQLKELENTLTVRGRERSARLAQAGRREEENRKLEAMLSGLA